MPPKNPWLNISWNNTIADCDKDFPVKVGRKTYSFGSISYVKAVNSIDPKVKLRFDCLPEPYYGDINAEVYCLNMNPGEPDPDFTQANDGNHVYEDFTKNVLSHNFNAFKNSACIYEKGKPIYDDNQLQQKILNALFQNPNPQNRILSTNPRPHVGSVWHMRKYRKLIDTLKRNPNFFFIEFFPYHSSTGFTFPNDLPSYEYRNWLINNAMKAGKTIIIMRQKGRWLKCINGLDSYPKTFMLSSAQAGCISQGNLCKLNKITNSEWNDILNKL